MTGGEKLERLVSGSKLTAGEGVAACLLCRMGYPRAWSPSPACSPPNPCLLPAPLSLLLSRAVTAMGAT